MTQDMVPYGRGKRFGNWVPDAFRSDFDSLWDNFFGDLDRVFGECCQKSEDGDLVYNIEVPGFSKDDLTVEIADGILEIKGERNIQKETRFAGQRSIHKRLTVGDVQDADAVVKDGILTLTLKFPKADVKKIEVVEEEEVKVT
jgi:HSP20 family molecular chaperone IbpA